MSNEALMTQMGNKGGATSDGNCCEDQVFSALQAAVTMSGEPTVLLDGTLVVLAMNDAAISALGVDGPAALGRPAPDVFGDVGYGHTIERVAQAALRGGGAVSARLTASDFARDTMQWKVKASVVSAGAHRFVLVSLVLEGPWWGRRSIHGFVDHAAVGSPEEFRVLLDLLPDIVFEVDSNGKVLYSNGIAVELLGYTPEELWGRSMIEFLAPADRDRFIRMLGQMMVGELVHRNVHYQFLASSGQEFPVEVNAIVVQGPNQEPRVLGIARDYTRRLRLEDRLRNSEQRYKDLFDLSRDLIFSVDRQGRILDINRTAVALTGKPRHAMVGTVFSDMLTETSKQAFKLAFHEAVEGRATDVEVQLVARRGRTTIIDIALAPMSSDGKVTGAHGTARDVTERRQLQQEMQHFQKMESLGRLAAGIAHDFNNILGVVLGLASVLERASELDAYRRDIEGIVQAARQGAELTRQILSFAQVGARRKDVVDLAALVVEVAELLRRTMPRNIVLDTDVRPKPIYVRGDAGQMRQVIVNLCMNAKDAMPSGGKVHVAVRRKRSVSRPEAGDVELTVQDEGPGVPRSLQARIFEPFFSTKGPEQGAGLGLAVCWGIVQEHGGRIHVENVRGAGALFHVVLPESKEVPRRFQTPKAVRESESGISHTALVIDDQPAMRRAAARMLETEGYRVWTAGCWEDVEKVCRARPEGFDVVLLDLSLPDVDGLDIYRRLRKIYDEPRVIAISGYSAKGVAQQILEEGAKAFLQKPFIWSELKEKLSKIV